MSVHLNNSPVEGNLADGVDVLVVGAQEVVNDHASPLVHLDAGFARDLVARAGSRVQRAIQGTVQRTNGGNIRSGAGGTAEKHQHYYNTVVWLSENKGGVELCGEERKRVRAAAAADDDESTYRLSDASSDFFLRSKRTGLTSQRALLAGADRLFNLARPNNTPLNTHVLPQLNSGKICPRD